MSSQPSKECLVFRLTGCVTRLFRFDVYDRLAIGVQQCNVEPLSGENRSRRPAHKFFQECFGEAAAERALTTFARYEHACGSLAPCKDLLERANNQVGVWRRHESEYMLGARCSQPGTPKTRAPRGFPRGVQPVFALQQPDDISEPVRSGARFLRSALSTEQLSRRP